MTPEQMKRSAESIVIRLMEADAPFAPVLTPSGWDCKPDEDLHPDTWRMIEALTAENARLRAESKAVEGQLAEVKVERDRLRELVEEVWQSSASCKWTASESRGWIEAHTRAALKDAQEERSDA